MNQPVYLMDASTFMHRAFHAIRNLATKDGRPTGAVYGFTSTLLKLMKEKKPQNLAVVFDSKGRSQRYDIYADYKANRGPMDPDLAAQQTPIREIVKAMGIFIWEEEGFEADDLIAAAARKFAAEGREVVIVSGDKDFYQLLSDHVSMYDPDPKKDSALNQDVFRQRFGIEPKSFLDMQALMGDSSDNIPGVPKVGEKTALKLITQFVSLDNIYANIDQVKPDKLRENLSANKEAAYISRELASLGHGAAAPFSAEDLRPAPLDTKQLRTIFQDLDFSRLLKDLESGDGLPQKERKHGNHNSKVSYDKYVLVSDEQSWAQLRAELEKAVHLAIDLETDSPSPSRCNIVGVSLCATEGLSFYVPIGHATLDSTQYNQSWDKFKEVVGPYLEADKPLKIGQNAKFDWLILRRHGIDPAPPTDDPMLASYLINPESRHGLDFLCPRYLDHHPISFKEMVPDSKKNFSDIGPTEALNYAAEDADVTLRLAKVLAEELTREKDLVNLYREVELPLEDLLARMEQYGVLLDAQRLSELSQQLGTSLKDLEDKIFAIAGHPFNIGSPKQLSEVLFMEMGLMPIKKTAKKTGFSTDDDVLAELSLIHPLPFEIRNWRSLDKLKSTYTDKLPKEINPISGRIHTSYNQTQTATGRLSSSGPNLQNIPVKGDEGRRIRSAFIAQPGYRLVSADYSQIELRVLAHFSQDRALLNAFINDEDIHTQTAIEIFGLNPEEVSPDRRREAKTINFGVVYGQGPFALGKQLGIPQAQARDFIERYFTRFPGVKHYMENSKEEARQSGQVSTWFGRRRILSAIESGAYQARQEAERMAINTPIQGTAADLIKMAMLAVDSRLAQYHPQARLIMQVHDELVVECPEKDAEAVAAVLKQEMSKVGEKPPLSQGRPLTVPLKVDVGIGGNWAEAH